MLGCEFRDADGRPDGAAAGRAQQAAVEHGLLLLTCGAWGQVARFIPALVVTAEQVDEAVGLWSRALDHVYAPSSAVGAGLPVAAAHAP